MSSNNNQEIVIGYQKHEETKEKRTKKIGFKGKRKNKTPEESTVLKKKMQPKKKNKYVNYKNIDFDTYDDFDDYYDEY